MAVSVYDEQFMTDEQKRKLRSFTDAWERARDAGDKSGMESAHAAAERLRAQAGNYSGDADGSGFKDLGGGYVPSYQVQEYRPSSLPSYEPQTDAVNALYDAAREAELAGLKTAFDSSSAELAQRREAVPEAYRERRDLAAAQSETAKRGFNEMAASTGLNSGAGGQARLAYDNSLQSSFSDLAKQEAQELSGLDSQLTQLKLKYQNDVAAAVAQGEYKRASALLDEYRRASESAVAVAQAQAAENYRAWQAQASNADRLADERYRAYQSGASARSEARKRAEDLAGYGDFSGYAALGYDDSTVAGMRSAWAAKNPGLAYDLGTISAEQYYDITGRWPASRR